MSWWRKLLGNQPASDEARLRRVRLTMPGWRDEGIRGELRGWRDDRGDFMTVHITEEARDLPAMSDEAALRDFFRGLAESRDGGLIEVRVSTGPLGPTVFGIYKRLLMPAYAFTGMLFAPDAEPPQIWTVVTQERGTTGVREAIVTAELLQAGRLTIEAYERDWAKDPYDADYRAADRRVLRFVSDDESYDERFPEHPLTRVRRILAALPGCVEIEAAGEEG